MDNDSRRVVIVLGAGRSGTSLLMQILVGMGMQVSRNLIPANVSNPEGFFEDADFKDIQAELYSCLNVTVSLPLPENWKGSSFPFRRQTAHNLRGGKYFVLQVMHCAPAKR
jgi:hypothetical protein